MEPIPLGVCGATGRMGRRVVALADADRRFRIVAAVDHPGHPDLGKDAGLIAGVGELGVPVTATVQECPKAIIDFSAPEGTAAIARWCAEHGVALVVATTGLDPTHKQVLVDAATAVPLLWAPNLSLAVNLTLSLAASAAEALRKSGQDVDVEIIERHHRFKEDAPSGTALWFGETIAGRMGQTIHRHGREGRIGPRPRHEIGYHAVRTGDDPGQHTIVFGLLGETIELVVRASNRDAYARGALEAAAYLVHQPPGTYHIADVLGLPRP